MGIMMYVSRSTKQYIRIKFSLGFLCLYEAKNGLFMLYSIFQKGYSASD